MHAVQEEYIYHSMLLQSKIVVMSDGEKVSQEIS